MSENHPKRVLSLTCQVRFRRPRVWWVHPRYAYLTVGEPMPPAPPGAWVLEIGPRELELGDGARQVEHLYRLATGKVVALDHALDGAEAVEVAEPQAVIAMRAYRSLEEAIYQDLGVMLHREQPGSPPFGLLRCPVCGASEFTSVDLASVWCEECNASFQVRATAGDPGFVVDCCVRHVHLLAARYLLPKVDCLAFHMVWKGGGDARDMRHDPQGACRSAARAGKCRPDALFLTGEDERTLRPGLHACHVDTVYDWKLSGEIPTPGMVSNLGMWQVDGTLWPLSASLERRTLDRFQAGRVRQAAAALRRIDDRDVQDAAGALERLAALPQGRADPLVWVQHLPPLSELGEGERYMLHRWLLQPSSSDADHVMAHPVWYVVKPVLQERRLEAWDVVRKDVCPACGRRVTALEAHAHCRKLWAETGWEPPSAEGGEAAPP